ncbi:MAG: hypothetical protein R3B07_13555 [Polyangiaceae bacterium]
MTSLGATLSVPCSRCSQPIRFGQTVCSCGEPVSSDLERALEERLKASSSEYRELDLKLTRARATLLVCAIGQLGFGALLYWFGSRGVAAEVVGDNGIPPSLVLDSLSALGFFVAFSVSGRQPMRGIALGALVWALSRASSWLLIATFSISGAFLSAAIALVLFRGFLAARDAKRLRRRLVAEVAAR